MLFACARIGLANTPLLLGPNGVSARRKTGYGIIGHKAAGAVTQVYCVGLALSEGYDQEKDFIS